MKTSPFYLFYKLSRPHFLLGSLMQILLGSGIAHYLEYRIDWNVFFISVGWALSLQLAIQYLIQYFNVNPVPIRIKPTFFTFHDDLLGEGERQLPRNFALVASAGMLTITTIFTLGMAQFNRLNLSLVIVMGIILVLALLYALPVVYLFEFGQGELVFAILAGIFLPGFGFIMQTGETHRLLILATLPLVIMLISVLLAFEFPNYAVNLKYQEHNLLLQLGWKSAMYVHNTFIFFSFVTLGLGIILGLPPEISLPPFLSFPLGLLQIWQMRRIEAGGKPNWRTLTWNAVGTFGLMNFTLMVSFWLN